MKYLAHRDQESEREQSLIDHLEKTAELAGQYAEAFGAYQCGQPCLAPRGASGLKSRLY